MAKAYYPIEDQINDCFKFLGIDTKDAHEMNEAELFNAEVRLREHFRWVGHPDCIQEIPQHIKTGRLIF